MGSRILKSACGMNLRTFGPCADATGAPSIMTAARAPIAAAVELHATQRLFIAGSPGPENGRTYLEEKLGRSSPLAIAVSRREPTGEPLRASPARPCFDATRGDRVSRRWRPRSRQTCGRCRAQAEAEGRA